MAVEPIPCSPGGGGEPVEVTTCCAPSIASTALCRADGTTILAVVRSGCVECGQEAEDPAVVGWLDAAGVFTPGALPTDAGPCETGCVDTICVQRCDDTDGDGAADATYSELWCVRADGSAELVLTYQSDPSVPYTPVSPVECTYGCPESETVTLCDDSGPFLRRYRFLQGAASYEDVELDWQTPHVVTGTVGVCDTSEPCEAQTTPAATLGLCLADGTPIAVVVTRDCDGTVRQDGWLNLTTGAYSAGDPPAGTMACGNPRNITTAGVFCDVAPVTGDVLGLVLVEYTYGPDGDVASVRLVDATSGATYVPQGEVTTCPAGVEQPERDLLQMCDTAGDGGVTVFVRDYARDENGQITGHSDYLLDGTPYTPTGEVGLCQPDAEPCRDTTTVLLCDTAEQEALTVFDPINRPGDDGWEIVAFTGQPGFGPEQPLPYPAVHPPGNPAYMGARSDMSAGPNVGPWAGYESAPLRWVMRKTFLAPQDGVATVSSVGFRGDGGARVRVNNTDAGMYGQWNQPATSGTAQIPVTAGPNTIEIEVRDIGGANWITGRLDIAMVQTRQFMRTVTVDCESGEVVATTDTTLDGEPYTPTGEVGLCEPVAECCPAPPPETRLDVETVLLCIQDAGGGITGQVLAERVYDDQTGERVVQRLADPTTGEEVELPDGAGLVLCQEPPCPTAFATECVGAVSRTDASYDNTSLIGGVPGQCGSVQGPADPPNAGANFGCAGGPYTITSWVVNGVEVIAEGGGMTFQGGPCGPGTAGNPGMHLNWAQALTNLDPTGATWVVDNAPGCAWFVRSEGGSGNVYGPMTVTGNGVGVVDGTWVLGAAQSCEETQYTKVYTQECDGSVSVSWLDAQGAEVAPPAGELVPCGTGCGSGGGRGLDVETLTLCDVAPDGSSVPFLRHITYGTGGQVATVVDTALDGFAPYTPAGTVGRCQTAGEGRDVEITPMCVIDNATGSIIQRIFAEVTYDTATGDRLGVSYVDPATWGPVGMPGGTHLDMCPPESGPEPEPCGQAQAVELCDTAPDGTRTRFLRTIVRDCDGAVTSVTDTGLDAVTPYTPAGQVGDCGCPQHLLEECRWDDTDNDGLGDVAYVELLQVDGCTGALTPIGTYLPDLSGPYEPVAPASECPVEGAPPARGVQARRVQLAPGASWDAATVPLLQSVTVTAHGGDGQITTSDGVSTLFPGESVTWSVARGGDAALTGPLIIAAGTGTVTVAFTQGVVL